MQTSTQDLTAKGEALIDRLAQDNDLNSSTVEALARALDAGGGRQAQFSLPELGGMGQWSAGGMVMVGDMFNHALKARVDALCSALADALRGGGIFEPKAAAAPGGAVGGWPDGLGQPSATGSQNGARYAVFPQSRRLAIEQDGQITVYDTLDHLIGGAAQQQGGGRSLSFSSQHGRIDIADLPVVSGRTQAKPSARPEPRSTPSDDDDVFAKIERLGELRGKDLISPQEFEAKKAELLQRI